MSDTASPVEVQIGEQKYVIQRFRGLKAILVFAAITRVSREVPDIMADAVKSYQGRNTVTVTEAMSHTRRWEGFTEEDFDRAEARSGKREIELPAPMTQNEQVMYALPDLLERARKEIVRLLALLIIPNTELREADENDKVEEALDGYRDVLLYDAEIDQLADLCLAANDVVREQLADRKDRLGEVIQAAMKTFQRNRPQTLSAPTPVASPQPTTEEEPTPLTSTQGAPTSSTDSEKPSDGTEAKPSMVSPGVSS